MLLYENPASGNCYKVRLTMAHLGLTCERRSLSVTDRSDRPAVLGHLNPALGVPTLVLDDGRPLAESNAIIIHLAEGTPLVPSDAYDRARMFQWMFWEQYNHEPSIAVLRFIVALSGDAAAHAERIPELRRRSLSALSVMETHLSDREYFAGDAFSLADIALYGYTHVADEAGLDLDGFPGVRSWLARVAARPDHIPMH